MFAILYALGLFAADLFKSRGRLQAENLFLRHQLNIALRRVPPRPRLRDSDRALLVWLTRICPSLLDLAQVAKPKRSCGGIAQASRLSGAGNLGIG
jgi:hypothetical protein